MGFAFAATIITDASFDPNTKAAGYGYCISSCIGRFTGGEEIQHEVRDCSVAEMMAIAGALVIAVNNKCIQDKDKVLIQTDSLAAIAAFKSTRKIREGQEMQVAVFFKKLVEKYKLQIEFRHVKGHTQHRGARFEANRLCDARARLAMQEARRKRLAQPHIDQIRRVLNAIPLSA